MLLSFCCDTMPVGDLNLDEGESSGLELPATSTKGFSVFVLASLKPKPSLCLLLLLRSIFAQSSIDSVKVCGRLLAGS
jgi:hypothetical protein